MKCEKFIANICNSCNLLNKSYEETILVKEKMVSNLFSDYQIIKKDPVLSRTKGVEARNKAKLAVFNNQDLEVIQFGFYSSAGIFQELEDCPLHAKEINRVLPLIKKLSNKHKIIPYDIKTKKGELKYLLITYSESTCELLIRFIMRSKESLERLRKLSSELIQKEKYVKVVTANIQPEHKAVLEGEQEIFLTDEDSISHKFGEYSIFQGAKSFFQTNSEVAYNLYSSLQEELVDKSLKRILDLFCGVGAFSLFVAKYAEEVVGVEISKEAIEYANKSKHHNKISNINFYAQDAFKYIESEKQDFDAIIVNPPRRGLGEKITETLTNMAPEYIFYSSCNIKTLKGDFEAKLHQVYEIKSLQIFDMFPFSNHFETLAILKKKN